MGGKHVAFVALRIMALAVIASIGVAVTLSGVLAPSEFGASVLDTFLLFYGGVAPVISLQGPFFRLADRTEATLAAVGALIAGFTLFLLPLSLAVQQEDRQIFGQLDWFAGIATYLVVTAICGINLVWRIRRMAA
jgi:hypothetical protein